MGCGYEHQGGDRFAGRARRWAFAEWQARVAKEKPGELYRWIQGTQVRANILADTVSGDSMHPDDLVFDATTRKAKL